MHNNTMLLFMENWTFLSYNIVFIIYIQEMMLRVQSRISEINLFESSNCEYVSNDNYKN